MTLRLILIRHAKSSWDDPALDDHARPLNDRGRRDAPRIGAWLAKHGHVPDLVLCSTAARTRETWDLIAPTLPEGIPVSCVPDLYDAGPRDMIAVIHRAEAPCVAVIGHNMTIGQVARQLAEARPDHPKFNKYPTAATLVLDFDTDDWRGVLPGTGRVVDFVVPKDLPD
ncbi:SixA phosphatase family protein [Roseovarius salinarum]|uniref:SixA phosphatase family protein n=1 Tax=Roseovarius salinarum TaxID=1981892 RepID=UPI000C348E77|nr:histidine phosphatase family protein [Roseovarius salinarum]